MQMYSKNQDNQLFKHRVWKYYVELFCIRFWSLDPKHACHILGHDFIAFLVSTDDYASSQTADAKVVVIKHDLKIESNENRSILTTFCLCARKRHMDIFLNKSLNLYQSALVILLSNVYRSYIH